MCSKVWGFLLCGWMWEFSRMQQTSSDATPLLTGPQLESSGVIDTIIYRQRETRLYGMQLNNNILLHDKATINSNRAEQSSKCQIAPWKKNQCKYKYPALLIGPLLSTTAMEQYPLDHYRLWRKKKKRKKFTTIIGIHRTDSSCYNLNRVRVLYYKQSKKRRKIPDPKKCWRQLWWWEGWKLVVVVTLHN